MIGRPLYARVMIRLDDPAERAFQARKVEGERRMRRAGVREASIVKYLVRGWPSIWARAVRKEMAGLIESLSLGRPRWKISQRDRDAAEARRLVGAE